MRRSIRLLFTGFLVTTLAAAAAQAQTCQTHSALVYGTYVDGGGQSQNLLLDLQVPIGATAATPLVVWVHGGGWSAGSRLPIPARVTALCPRGYAIASVDYRLSGTATWPAQIHDVKGAIRWLRASAATYNLDPDRFGVWGSSAGGHLVAFLGAAGGVGPVTIGNVSLDLEGTTGGNLGHSSRVQAVVDWFGPTDLLQMRFYPSGINHDAVDSPEGRLLGGAVPDSPERVATANPITFLSPDDPPYLIMHGTVDNTVPFHQSELLHRALLGRNLRGISVPILGAGHGGAGFEAPANLQMVNGFLDANLLNLPNRLVSIAADAPSIAENAGATATFTVTRTGNTGAPLTVRFGLSGTAGNGQDYTVPALQVIIPAGEASAPIVVTPTNDNAVEGAETVVAALAQSAGYRLDAAATSASLTLTDDESAAGRPVVTVTATDAVASEAGPGTGTFRIARTGSTAANLQVSLRLNGTAVSGIDYTALPATATIPAGQATVDLTLIPLADALLEPTETAILTVNAAAAYALGSPAAASVRIGELNQASTLPIVAAVAIDFAAAELADGGAFQVSRTGSTAAPLTAGVSPAGTATEGLDYGALPDMVSFGAGVNRVTVPLAPLDDFLDEPAETVTLRAVAAASLLVGPASAPVSIVDND